MPEKVPQMYAPTAKLKRAIEYRIKTIAKEWDKAAGEPLTCTPTEVDIKFLKELAECRSALEKINRSALRGGSDA